MPRRDPMTGELLHKISVDVRVSGQVMPLVIDCADWKAARAYLSSAEFKRIAPRVEFVTITNREAP